MPAELLRRQQAREVEIWIARVRLAVVVFAGLEVGVFTENYPSGYESLAWIATGVFAFGAVVLLLVSRRAYTPWVGLASLVFDGAVIAAFATLYSFEYGSPTRWALMFVVVEGALRYGLVGAVGVSVALLPFLAYVEWWRAREFGGPSFIWDRVTFPFGVFLTTGLIVGWLVNRLRRETAVAESRAREAEGLRDQLGRRVDVLEAANRCARALASSLEVDQAFRRLHSRVARAGGLRPGDDRARRGRPRRGSGGGGARHRRRLPAGLGAPRARLGARGGARGLACLQADAGCGAVSRGRGPARPRPAQPRARAAAGRAAHDRDARARAHRGGCVLPGGAGARRAARTAGGDGGSEHPGLRRGANDRGGAAPALGAPRRLRLARLPRAAEPDGGCHRRGADA